MDNYNKLFMIIRKTDLLNYDEKNELQLYLMNLKEQVKKQKEVINKAIKYFEENYYDCLDFNSGKRYKKLYNPEKLLYILNEVSK